MMSKPLFGAKRPGGLFGHLLSSTAASVNHPPRKDDTASPVKTRIPAPMASSPQKPPALPTVKVKQLTSSPLRNKLKQGPRIKAGAREKARLLGSKPTTAATLSAKKLASATIPGKTFSGNLFGGNKHLSTGASTSQLPPPTPGQRKGNTIRALDGLGKALERLSMPRPSRPPSALGHRPSEALGNQAGENEPSLPRSSAVMNFASVEGEKPGPGVGKLGLPMRRPGQFSSSDNGLEPVEGSPLKVSNNTEESSDAKPKGLLSPMTALGDAFPGVADSSFVFNDADISSISPGKLEDKFSVDELLLKMNGIAPRVVSDSTAPPQKEHQVPTPSNEPATSTHVESASTSQQPKINNTARVTQVSRALSLTIAERTDNKLARARRSASERQNRPIRSASIVQRERHQQQQARQTNGRPAGSLDVLKGCAIYVDIATEDGEDASGLFVDMLRGLGARVCNDPLVLLHRLLIVTTDFKQAKSNLHTYRIQKWV